MKLLRYFPHAKLKIYLKAYLLLTWGSWYLHDLKVQGKATVVIAPARSEPHNSETAVDKLHRLVPLFTLTLLVVDSAAKGKLFRESSRCCCHSSKGHIVRAGTRSLRHLREVGRYDANDECHTAWHPQANLALQVIAKCLRVVGGDYVSV